MRKKKICVYRMSVCVSSYSEQHKEAERKMTL